MGSTVGHISGIRKDYLLTATIAAYRFPLMFDDSLRNSSLSQMSILGVPGKITGTRS